jgi:hypothetical protein
MMLSTYPMCRLARLGFLGGFFSRLPAARAGADYGRFGANGILLGFGGAGSVVGTEAVANGQVVTGNRLIATLAGIFRRGCDVLN